MFLEAYLTRHSRLSYFLLFIELTAKTKGYRSIRASYILLPPLVTSRPVDSARLYWVEADWAELED